MAFITGTAANQAALRPDWKNPYVTNYAYKTEVFVSRSGREQRRALRHTPRFYSEFDFLLAKGGQAEFDRMMASRHNKPFVMPDFTESETTSAAAYINAEEVVMSNLQPWMVAGATIAIDGSSVHKINSVSGKTLSIYPAVTHDCAAGTTVFLAYPGFIQPTVSVDTPTNTVGRGKVRFDALPLAFEPPDVPAAAVTYNGREVFLRKPNWSTAPQVEYEWPLEQIDYGRGTTAQYDIIQFSKRSVRQTYLGKSRDEVREFRNFFARMRGSRGEFYMPTWKPDMEMYSNIVSGSYNLVAKGTTVYEYLEGDTVYKRIAVIKNDGTILYNTVSSMSLSGENTILSCSSPWPTLNVADVTMVCWMPAWTLASDILTISWLTDRVANIGLTMRTVEDIDV